MTVAVIPAGGLAKVGASYATYPSYGELLDELAVRVGGLEIYGPVIEPNYPEYEYHSAHLLNPCHCKVIPLPAHPRGEPRARILKNYTAQFLIFLRHARSWRRVLIYTPSITAALATLAWRVMHASPRVSVAYVWGDWQQLAEVLPQRGALRRVLDPVQRRVITHQEAWLVGHADATLVAGRALLRKYRDLGKMVTETPPMIRLGELAGLQPSSGQRGSHLVTVGRLVPGKGIETLLEALLLVRREVPSARLRIVGNGDSQYVSELKAISARLGLINAVRFEGIIPNGEQLWSVYRDAGLFVCPSLSEGFPRVIYEALALGAPIVSTTVGGIPDMLSDRVHALLVPPGDAPTLAAACVTVLNDSSLAQRLARAGRALFEDVCRRAVGAGPASRLAILLDENNRGK